MADLKSKIMLRFRGHAAIFTAAVSHPRSFSAVELPPRDRTHQPFPFVKASPKAECASFIVADPRRDLTPLAAFRFVRVSILTPGYENVRGERVVVPLHFLDGCIHFAHSLAECRERILQAIDGPSRCGTFLRRSIRISNMNRQSPIFCTISALFAPHVETDAFRADPLQISPVPFQTSGDNPVFSFGFMSSS
jgi:hypothetical protein